MTREEILARLKEDKSKGLSYKWIAAEIGVTVDQLYKWIYGSRPYKNVAAALEEYYTKGSENNGSYST